MRSHDMGMGYAFIAFIILMAPLAYFLGADSRIYREDDRRGWFPGVRND